MKKALRIFHKTLLSLLGAVFMYIAFAFILSVITTSPKETIGELKYEVFVKTNGVHTDLIFNQQDVRETLLSKLNQTFSNYLAFGWGDKGFYIGIPTWDDLTFSIAVNAMFFPSETAMHVTPYSSMRSDWVSVKINKFQLDQLQDYIEASFQEKNNQFKKIAVEGYSRTDAFYKAKGSYNLFKTCNVWTNEALKTAEIKTAVWSPFDWGIIWNL